MEDWNSLGADAQLNQLNTDDKGRNLLILSAAQGGSFAVGYLLHLPKCVTLLT